MPAGEDGGLLSKDPMRRALRSIVTQCYNFFTIIILNLLVINFATPSSRLDNSCNCVCGVRGRSNRIVGGKEATPHDQPWLAGLWRQGKLYCGATVLSRNFLITAAHCVYGFNHKEIRVYIGGHEIRKDYTEVTKIKNVYDHEKFDVVSFNNDIALIELEKPLEFGPKVQPICLPSATDTDYAGVLTSVSGWGRTGEKDKTSKVLNSVIVPIWSQEQCKEAGYGAKRITENMMCAGYHDGGRDACQGDSGGSAIAEGPSGSAEIIGVVSWGRGCARPNLPGIYTRVSNYMDWINDKISDECLCQPKQSARTGFFDSFFNYVGLWMYFRNYNKNSKSLHFMEETEKEISIYDSVVKVSENDVYSESENILKEMKNFPPNRTARFLFDALFRIGSDLNSILDYDDADQDVDYDINSHVRTCDCECGHSNEEIRIIGGRPTGVNQYPWMARLVYDGKFHCGGTVLTKDYVLTAAHCVKRLRKSKIRIIFGDHDQHVTNETQAIQRAVTKIVKHRKFDPETYNNDIALLRLRKSLNLSRNILPICLPRYNYDPAGRIGTVVGWGRTSEGGELPGLVSHVKVPIMTITECRNQKYKSTRITSSMVCAGKPNMDSCQGDSGGPLLLSSGLKYHIVGIVSWGVGCGREGYPGVYTRVSKFVPWIKANLDSTCLFFILFGFLSQYCFANPKTIVPGKYRAYTQNKELENNSINKPGKIFGVFNRNRSNTPPRHDTPASPCTCRCGERNDETRIVGGQDAGVNEFPWMARLSYFNRFYCGGTLINDRYVLTAAHCVKGFMWFMIKVTFGEHNRCNDTVRPETRFVLRAISQKFSFTNFDNDIALLRLNDRVPITDFIRPICLPAKTKNRYVGTKGVVTGWGTLKEDGKPSCILQEVEVPVLANDICAKETNYTQKMITDNMMCAGYPGVGQRDSCQGDSGGPMVAQRSDKRYEQIGIVSWGNGCARPHYPGVYTRVTNYLDWIEQNSKDGCFCNE
ncbi:transmembrane protease serine 9-like [Condylostylus longicornis]|uniref:transmembrane protease serine 9-like n=1 Tax=Condylostylus longicornis TaxID=2530218 RepID=UPI00244DD006|nr:transmembrane protease serine 9-like [Condylostylus longicornis]